jgi:hypothetical protein
MTFVIGVSVARHEPELLTTRVECSAGRLTLLRGPSPWRVLLSFENQDLKHLNQQSALNLRNAIDTLRGKVDTEIPFKPRLFKLISNTEGHQRYVLVEYFPLTIIPGESHLRFHVFDTSGALLNIQERSMNRTLVKSVHFRKLATTKHDVLMVNTMYCLGGGDETEFYALVGNELRVVQSGK